MPRSIFQRLHETNRAIYLRLAVGPAGTILDRGWSLVTHSAAGAAVAVGYAAAYPACNPMRQEWLPFLIDRERPESWRGDEGPRRGCVGALNLSCFNDLLSERATGLDAQRTEARSAAGQPATSSLGSSYRARVRRRYLLISL